MKKTKCVVRKIKPERIESIIKGIGGKFFTVTFVKRTDNTLRTMNCHTGVKKDLVGGERKKKKNPGLITVFSMADKGYRMINLSGVRKIRSSGTEWRVVA